ncbi:MAG: acyl-CoA dehydrogenase family protein, partial [Actinomycetota bacterium]|nr:acyl-CoA dehydrogenase family protein [Actinomycetota bacterium]
IAALSMINGARTYVASMCCAMIRSALGAAVRYTGARQTFGQPVIEHQGLAWSLADVANQLEAARLLTDRAAETIDEQGDRAALLHAAHAKKFATEIAEPCIIACIQAMGAEGLREKHGLGQHLASARIANYVDGSTQIQTDRIAKSLTTEYS